jgi:hypothetical protein
MKARNRLLLVVVCLWVGYQIIQWPVLRHIYSADDKWAHAAAFFSVWWAFSWAARWRPITLTLLAAGLGAAVEVHQMFLPGFTPSWADWGADLIGIALAWGLYAMRERHMGSTRKAG